MSFRVIWLTYFSIKVFEMSSTVLIFVTVKNIFFKSKHATKHSFFNFRPK